MTYSCGSTDPPQSSKVIAQINPRTVEMLRPPTVAGRYGPWVRRHLVDVDHRRRRAPDGASPFPVGQQMCGARVTTLGVGRVLGPLRQVDVHDAERARAQVLEASGAADNVVRR